MRSNPLHSFLVTIALGLAQFGCSDSSSKENAPPPAAVPPEPNYDLAAIMEGMAETFRTERRVYEKALRSWNSIDDAESADLDAADHQALWSALQERIRLHGECTSMLAANPQWTESYCGWFASVVYEPYKDLLDLKGKFGTREWELNRTLLLGAAGSDEALQAYLDRKDVRRFAMNNLTMCMNSGFIEYDGDLPRVIPQDGD